MELEQKIEALSALQNVSATMNSMRDLGELRQYILEQALDVAGAKNGSLMVLDEEHRLRITNARGLTDKIIRQTRIKLGEGISGSVASIGEPLLVTNIEEDERFRRPSHSKYETRSLVCVPLRVRNKTIGVLNVNNKKSGGIFNQDDLEILTLLANQAAVATENANLYERMNTNLAEYRTLKAAIDAALKGHSVTEMIRELLNQAVTVTSGTIGILFLTDEPTQELYAESVVGTVADELREMRIPLGQGAIGEAAGLRQELSVDDGSGHAEPVSQFKNMIGQPLTAEGAILGFVVVGDKTEADRFGPEDLAALKTLANEIVFVLHISRADSATAAEDKKKKTDRMRGRGDDSLRYLEVINAEATRMSKLIEDLVRISRLEAEPATLDLRPASLPAIIEKTLESMAQLAEYKVEIEAPGDLSAAIVDADKISQILINLLSNAAAYSEPGQPIKIAVEEEPDRFIVSVIDAGSGIAPEDQKHIFDKFYRAGLAIVKYLVNQQGGKIGVESSPGLGSTFWFTVPKGSRQYV